MPPESRGILGMLDEPSSVQDSMATHMWMQIEIERQMHRLAAEYYTFRQFWFLFFPPALMTLVSGILSFVTTSEPTARLDSEVNVALSIVVGILSLISTFWQTLNDQLKYGARKERHASAALDLKTILDSLDFADISRLADSSVKANVSKYHELYSQVMIGCKSNVPIEIDQAFRTLGTRLFMELPAIVDDGTAEALTSFNREQLLVICYNEMYCTIAQGWLWPMALPDAETAIQKTIERLCVTLAGDMTEAERAEMGTMSIGKLVRYRRATHRSIPGPKSRRLPVHRRPETGNTAVRTANVSR
uniref:SMODS and SLOG-associating 2TM effector domain-containing protein n=1 Tax=Eutreptiella gymnastica TaxID=73025 RepID=A0A7S1HS77_9EUGL